MEPTYTTGRVLFLKRPVAGLPHPTGYWVVCSSGVAQMTLALLTQDAGGLCAGADRYEVSAEDLLAYEVTHGSARVD